MTKSLEQIKTLKESEEWLLELSRMIYEHEVSPEHACILLTKYTAHIMRFGREKKNEWLTTAQVEIQIAEFTKYDNLN